VASVTNFISCLLYSREAARAAAGTLEATTLEAIFLALLHETPLVMRGVNYNIRQSSDEVAALAGTALSPEFELSDSSCQSLLLSKVTE